MGSSGHGSVVADIASYSVIEPIFIDDGDNIHPPFESIKFNIETPIALELGIIELERYYLIEPLMLGLV